MYNKEKEVLVVFTSEVMKHFTLVGGTSTWNLNIKRAKHCEYVVCVRNGGENHGNGFLVGRISAIRPSKRGIDSWKDSFETKSSERFTVYFSEYADIDAPEFWGKWKNPVRYLKEIDALSMLNITSFDELTFKPLPTPLHTVEQEQSKEKQGHKKSGALDDAQGLTIDQAKAGIALRMGISPQNIEIRITT
jgi:hypothetical protein